VTTLIENIVQQYPELYEQGELLDALHASSQLKFRDLIADTVSEYLRMNNFCMVYPARNSKLYDKYFTSNKSLAKVIYKVLCTPEIIPFGVTISQEVQLKSQNVQRSGGTNQPGVAQPPNERELAS